MKETRNSSNSFIWTIVVVVILLVSGIIACFCGLDSDYRPILASVMGAISTAFLGLLTLWQADENRILSEKANTASKEAEEKAKKEEFIIRNTPEIVLKQLQNGKNRDGATIVDFGVCDMVYNYAFTLCLEVLDLPILGFRIKEYSAIVINGNQAVKKPYEVIMRQVGDNNISGYLRKNSDVLLWMPEIMSDEDNPYKFEIVFQYQNIYKQIFEKTIRFQYIDEKNWSFNYIGEAIMVKDRETK